ncbi:MAG: N-acetyl-gamma-glutamyl-phosphate reductase, partial [Sphingopyxis sp.]
MTISVFIDGAAGTTGIDIAERLANRPDLTLITLDDDRRKDAAARAQALRDADFAILCLPDDAAKEAAALAQGSNVR